jgi:serine protease Do
MPDPKQPTTVSPTSRLNPVQIVIISVVAALFAGALGAWGVMAYIAHGGKLSTELSRKEVVSQDRAIIDVASKVSPSVVSIVSSQNARDIFGRTVQQTGAGTGIIVKADGLIMTNKHVVSGGTSFTIITSDGKQYEQGKVVATDPTNDIAFLKIDPGNTKLQPAELGDSSTVEVGQTVIAIGNALGQFQNTVTTGVISGKSRPITAGGGNDGSENLQNLFQTDAAINPGNSGGPLVSIDGKVIGINTAVAGEGAQNIGFAIPINEAKADLASVIDKGKITKAYLGVRYVAITPDFAQANGLSVDHGAFVQGSGSVLGDSPAAKAGLQQGDIITRINNTDINADNPLSSVIAQFKPGETVTLTVIRGGKTTQLKATLGEAPSSSQ